MEEEAIIKTIKNKLNETRTPEEKRYYNHDYSKRMTGALIAIIFIIGAALYISGTFLPFNPHYNYSKEELAEISSTITSLSNLFVVVGAIFIGRYSIMMEADKYLFEQMIKSQEKPPA